MEEEVLLTDYNLNRLRREKSSIMGKARESLKGPLCFVIVVHQYQKVLRAIMMCIIVGRFCPFLQEVNERFLFTVHVGM
jgi:hypothetical protein